MKHTLIVLLALGLCCTATAQRPGDLSFYRPGSSVLGLYDSTDEGQHSYKEVLLKRVKPTVEAMGLRMRLHDVGGKELPTPEILRETRAIVTAFDDAKMVGAQRYVAWLRDAVESGKQLVILNNFGAYQDSDTKQWLDPEAVNSVLRPLGVAYEGAWTDKGEHLRLAQPVSPLVKKGFDLAATQHYYMFRKIADDVTGHVVVERVDPDAPKAMSVPVFTSSRGGMALSRYYETVGGQEQIDRRAFLEAALFPSKRYSNRVLFLVDPDTSSGHAMLEHLRWVLSYSWLPEDVVTYRDAAALRRPDLNRYGVIAVASDGAERLGDQLGRDIERWVTDGGGLVLMFPTSRTDWNKMLGITRRGGEAVARTGVRYDDGFFPGLEGLVVQDRGDEQNPGPLVVSQVPPVTLTGDTAVLASAVDVGSPETAREPVMWTRRHGAGRVIVRNDYGLTNKSMRGHALQMLMHAQKVGVVPQINAAVYFVDDNPQPMWGVKNKPYKGASEAKKGSEEYRRTDTDFYRNVWWNDLMAQAREFDVKLTFVLIFSYDDNTSKDFSTGPFYGAQAEGAPLWMAREAVRLGHEVGLHGFNHQSLVLKREGETPHYTSRGWESRQSMVDSLLAARAEWQRVFGQGQVPFTYIAPNNHIDRAGKEAVQMAFPEIRVMAAQYLPDNIIPGQEFQVDPEVPHFMDMPRVSSEFYIGAHNNLVMHDAIMLTGAWTHFVHPDDVYDPERDGGMGWEQLAQKSREMFQHMRSAYPWMRSLTARDAYHEIVRYTSGPFHYEVTGDQVVVHHAGSKENPASFMVRLDPGVQVTGVENGRIRHSDSGYAYYFVEGTAPRTVLNVTWPSISGGASGHPQTPPPAKAPEALSRAQK